MPRLLLLASFVWGALPSAQAAPAPSPAAYLTLRTWRVRDGLPSATVQSVLAGRDGRMWLGLQGVVARFDGARFERVDLAGAFPRQEQVRSLFQDADGRLWASTLGVGLLSFADDPFVARASLQIIKPSRDGLQTNNVAAACSDRDGVLWVGTTGGLARAERGRFVRVSGPPRSVVKLACAPDGTVWVAPGDGPPVRLRRGIVVDTPAAAGVADVVASSIVADDDGTVWVGGEGELAQLGPGAAEWQRFGAADGLPSRRVDAVHRGRDGTVWVGTWGGGLARSSPIEGARRRFAILTMRDGLAGDAVTSVAEDEAGGIWVGSTDGLTRISRRPFELLAGLPSDAEGSVLGPLAEDAEGAMWIGTEGAGVLRVDARGARRFSRADGLPSEFVHNLAVAADGALLANTAAGLARLGHDGRFGAAGRGGPLEGFCVALGARDGRLWAASPGLGTIRGGTIVPDARFAGLPGFDCALAEAPDGALWASARGEMVRLVGDAPAARFRLPVDRSSFVGVNQIGVSRDGTVWAASAAGLFHIGADGVHAAVDREGAPFAEPVARVVEDDGGHLWLGSRRGLLRVTPTPQSPWVLGDVRRWDAADGLRSADFSYLAAPGAVRARDGKLWLTTTTEVVIVDPARVGPAPAAPAVHVSRLSVDGRDLRARDGVVVPARPATVEITFDVVAFDAPDRVRLRHRLRGVDSEWRQSSGSSSTARYGRLPPGRYVFEAAAALQPGVWATPSSWELVVAAAWHERVWVRLAAALLVLVVLPWTWHRRRLRVVRARYQAVHDERTRIARDLHDGLGQGFTSLGFHLDALGRRLGDAPPDVLAILSRTRAVLDHVRDESRRSVTGLRRPELGALELGAALAELARTTQGPARVGFRSSGSALVADAFRDAELLQVAREAVTNAQRHASARQVWIDLGVTDEQVTLRIHDDGVGFDYDRAALAQDGRFGLLGMRERVRRLDGAFELTSRPGSGTTVTVVVPHGQRAHAQPGTERP